MVGFKTKTVKINYLKLLEADFDQLDWNHSGTLDKTEIRDCLIMYGFDEDSVEDFLKHFDSNKDGKISKDEFLAAAREMRASQVKEADMRRVFKKADKDNTGKIDAQELRQYLRSQSNVVSMEQCEKWIRQYDVNKDHQLNYEEFLKFVRSVI